MSDFIAPEPDFKPKSGSLRSDRRVFIINLPFEEPWQAIRDWFKETINCEDAFVQMHNHPVTGAPMGAAHVEFRTVEDCDAAAARSTEEYKGRKIIINKDTDNMHLKVWCRKKNLSFRMDRQFKPVLEALGGDRGPAGPADGYNPPPPSLGGRPGPPPRFENEAKGPESAPPKLQPLAVGYDPYGKPLINDVSDLLATSVFFSNFPFKVSEQDIDKLFSMCGLVTRIQMMYWSCSFGHVEKVTEKITPSLNMKYDSK